MTKYYIAIEIELQTCCRQIAKNNLERKIAKDGTPVNVMKNITPLDPTLLGEIAKETQMVVFGGPLPSPPPIYDVEEDAIVCSVRTKYGSHEKTCWTISPEY